MKIDSYNSTNDHIDRVGELLDVVIEELIKRKKLHDFSKTINPEKEWFDIYTDKLKDLVYGSEEYKTTLKKMKPCLDHHYEKNRHHPEHYENGINNMTLVDLLEMIIDWKAASERHSNGDIFKSIEINNKRFKIDKQLNKIITNTMLEFYK